MDVDWFKQRKKELRVSDEKIAAAIHRERSVVNKVLAGKVRFDLAFVPGLAETLQVSAEEILRRAGGMNAANDAAIVPETNAHVVKLEGASLEQVEGNLPVYGTALGAARPIEGEAIEQTTLNRGEVIEYVKRPVLLNRKRKAYALYVQGSSMHPALPDGEMAVVVPESPLSVGDNVVVYLRPENPEDDDGESARAVLVKELVKRTATYVELRQYSPAMDFRLDASEILRIDRILTRKEMLS